VGKGKGTEGCLDQRPKAAQTICNCACQHSRSSEGPLGEVEKAAKDP
jgi:hypothetical protein